MVVQGAKCRSFGYALRAPLRMTSTFLFQKRFEAVGVEADHDFVVDDDSGRGLAVELDKLAQCAHVSLYVLVLEGDVARGQELLGREARWASGLAVKDYALHGYHVNKSRRG